MNPEFAYFLKVNAALALFYAFYRLLFYKDTFFTLRRFILLAFFCLAFLYPLLNMQGWMREQEQLIEIVAVYASMMLPEVTVTPDVATVAAGTFNWAVVWPVMLSGLYVLESSGLYNSFNVLHIKNRILMMNKKRSHGIGRAKYLFFIPLVLVLMLLNNIGALANGDPARVKYTLPVIFRLQ